MCRTVAGTILIVGIPRCRRGGIGVRLIVLRAFYRRGGRCVVMTGLGRIVLLQTRSRREYRRFGVTRIAARCWQWLLLPRSGRNGPIVVAQRRRIGRGQRVLGLVGGGELVAILRTTWSGGSDIRNLWLFHLPCRRRRLIAGRWRRMV